MAREPEELEEATFTWPLIGALYGSVVIIAIVALLGSHLGSGLDDRIDAPARALLAVPVLASAAAVFVASMVALLLPAYRRAAMRVAEIASWLIPAWLVMGAMVLGAISYAIDRAD
jgi:hypothetical protein